VKVLAAVFVAATTLSSFDLAADPLHVPKKGKGQVVAASPTLRDILELEAWILDKNPCFFGEADQAKRAQALDVLLPTLGEDETLPAGTRQRLAGLDGNAAAQFLAGTQQARDAITRSAFARGDASPRATARAEMHAAVATNDVTVTSPAQVMQKWISLQAGGSRTGLRAPSTEKGFFDPLRKKPDTVF
jgi:hypothetical protein